MHPVGGEGEELVLVRGGRAGEHGLEFEGLAGEVLGAGEVGDFGVGDAVEGGVGGCGGGYAGCHLCFWGVVVSDDRGGGRYGGEEEDVRKSSRDQ